jgi:hypothetical protein
VLKDFGFVLDMGCGSFTDRVSEILAGKRLRLRLVRPLLKAWAAVAERRQGSLGDRGTGRHLPAHDERTRDGRDHRPRLQYDHRQFMAFQQLANVGAYLGLTPRCYASGEIDGAGRISKCGDGLALTYLVEAAGLLLTRSKAASDLKGLGPQAGQTSLGGQGAAWPASSLELTRFGGRFVA